MSTPSERPPPVQAAPDPNWTPVALSADIPAATVAPGQLGEADLAIWRAASGRIAAWSDRCPHRGMRLSHGFVRGEALSCIYHGWRYGASGACLKIPAHPDLEPPEAIRVPAFEVTESAGLVWVSAAEAPTAPPEYPGLIALRFIEIACPESTLARHLGRSDPMTPVSFGAGEAVAVLQSRQGGCTGFYALVPKAMPTEERCAASRVMEDLRRAMEKAEGQAA